MTAYSARQGSSGGIALRKLWWAALVAIVASVVANVVTLLVLRPLLNLPVDFPPLQIPPIAIFTTVGVVLGALTLAIISRVARQPIRVFNIVAVVALLISLIPNVLSMLNPASAPLPGGTSFLYGILIVFHIVAAVVSVPLLTRLARD